MSSSTRSSIASQATGPVAAAVALIVAFILAVRGTSLLYPPDYSATGWLWALGATVLAAFAFASLQRREGETLLAARSAPFVPMRRMAIGFILMLAGLVLELCESGRQTPCHRRRGCCSITAPAGPINRTPMEET